MIERCHNPRRKAWSSYGARGIEVCAAWRADYGAFTAWAVANGYAANLEIDRIDNDIGYQPDNCRWATDAEQGRNRRNTLWMTAFGETKTQSDWGRDQRCAVSNHTLRCRLAAGETLESALTRPPSKIKGVVKRQKAKKAACAH
jgi:hypothetical protein